MHLISIIPLLTLSLTVGVCLPAHGQSSSVLSSGSWYAVAVQDRGVYKITHDDFKKMGFSSPINPHKIKVFGNVGGMLPQAINEPRPIDLTENAIFVAGAADGTFDRADYVLFFAEGADRIQFDIKRQVFAYEKNVYSDKNYYFITVADDDGLRI